MDTMLDLHKCYDRGSFWSLWRLYKHVGGEGPAMVSSVGWFLLGGFLKIADSIIPHMHIGPPQKGRKA